MLTFANQLRILIEYFFGICLRRGLRVDTATVRLWYEGDENRTGWCDLKLKNECVQISGIYGAIYV